MIIDIVMPKMGESITEGTILEWRKEVGDPIALDEILLEIGILGTFSFLFFFESMWPSVIAFKEKQVPIIKTKIFINFSGILPRTAMIP